ncbi:hypothetical protein EVAR_90417_1 [Eumeta japonica]|uniref:Uncharacterized protein n=1 Tax=Eumeta variegata TaxID=151549 RepID=A0A4C1Y7U1_EUMVA|nr:hypothetical protein EVAR_90417_1 [Eumeta japonica]
MVNHSRAPLALLIVHVISEHKVAKYLRNAVVAPVDRILKPRLRFDTLDVGYGLEAKVAIAMPQPPIQRNMQWLGGSNTPDEVEPVPHKDALETVDTKDHDTRCCTKGNASEKKKKGRRALNAQNGVFRGLNLTMLSLLHSMMASKAVSISGTIWCGHPLTTF